ncbi:MAG: peroxidase [Candidatus Afipia apatlaquensis]|uniref:Peroxidase n=1 Tax=Candidatus Afipia apatlaquensis TaxID=2712852 RepID=A0A7C9RHN3_9BRAD|nr:peroxidase [Candidatus Afipia apatlaquensis]
MENVEWDDVQRLVLSGYPKLPFSAYVFWHFVPGEVDAARKWLRLLSGRLTRATGRGDQQAINLALTAHGLEHLRVSDGVLSSFSLEFLEGMAPKPTPEAQFPRRSNVLGDVGDSSPELWEWGGWKESRDIDGMLLLYAADQTKLRSLIDAEIGAMAGAAAPALRQNGEPLIIEGRVYDDRKEHFGFTDGISQPLIEGSPKANGKRTSDADNNKKLTSDEKRILLVKPGEFVLGYRNERRTSISDVYPERADADTEPKDIRRNGTYLVFRQLEQDVPAFNEFVAKTAERIYGRADEPAQEKIASQLVGRTRQGHPLVPIDCPPDAAPRNDFLYYFEDRFGMACPIGAHIRRANPRDTVGPDADTALRLSKMHRIIRRGRPYGERVGSEKEGTTGELATRGMAFIALNADIAGQFEMIQHSWLNNTHFGSLYAGTDPLGHFSCAGDVVTIQDRPTNHHVDRPRPFVRVRGGAYFFLPGIEAVRALAR